MADEKLSSVLKKCNLTHLLKHFQADKITTDLICQLSMSDFHSLDVTNASDVMALRTRCTVYGKHPPEKQLTQQG